MVGCGFDHIYPFPRLQPQNASDRIFQAVLNELLKHLQMSPAVPSAQGAATSPPVSRSRRGSLPGHYCRKNNDTRSLYTLSESKVMDIHC